MGERRDDIAISENHDDARRPSVFVSPFFLPSSGRNSRRRPVTLLTTICREANLNSENASLEPRATISSSLSFLDEGGFHSFPSTISELPRLLCMSQPPSPTCLVARPSTQVQQERERKTKREREDRVCFPLSRAGLMEADLRLSHELLLSVFPLPLHLPPPRSPLPIVSSPR